ncbi:hypothetical protein [Nocardioides ultimimeridianus]
MPLIEMSYPFVSTPEGKAMDYEGGRLEASPFSVFHYTDAAGLHGIVSGRTLWASGAAGLNDSAEVRQGWAAVAALLAELPATGAADLLRMRAEDPLQAPHEVFVLSASTRGDDAAQWRLYASSGAGYAVELDPSVGLAVVEQQYLRNPPPLLATVTDFADVSRWNEVLYDRARVRVALQELVAKVDEELDGLPAPTGDPDVDDAWFVTETSAYKQMAELAHLIKEPGFSGESEMRVVATFDWGDRHVRYRPGPGGLVGYVPLAVPGADRSPGVVVHPGEERLIPIRSVRLGPRLGAGHLGTVTAFLRANGYQDVEVRMSEVPLR